MRKSGIAGRKFAIVAIALAASAAVAPTAQAQSRQVFSVADGGLNATSVEECFGGLCGYVRVTRVKVNGDKNEVCAFLRNNRGSRWSGAYRLTQRDDPTTFASLTVDPGMTAKRCEILPKEFQYWVVLRQDN